MNIVDCKQGTEAWFNARCGRVTASEIVNVLAFLKKGGESAARAAYKAKIVAETLTGAPALDGYLSPFMQHGTEMEPFARAAYEMRTDQMVDQVGFVIHPSIERAGASPDGLCDPDGCVEIKAPKTETHIRYMLAGVVPEEYEPQMMWEMACTGRQWCDFVSVDMRLPARHQLFIKRLPRDEARIAEIEAAVLQFLGEVDEMIAAMEKLNPPVDEPVREQPEIEDGITQDDIDWITKQQQEA